MQFPRDTNWAFSLDAAVPGEPAIPVRRVQYEIPKGYKAVFHFDLLQDQLNSLQGSPPIRNCNLQLPILEYQVPVRGTRYE